MLYLLEVNALVATFVFVGAGLIMLGLYAWRGQSICGGSPANAPTRRHFRDPASIVREFFRDFAKWFAI